MINKLLLVALIILSLAEVVIAETHFPDFSLQTIEKTEVTQKTFVGKYWLMNFYFTKCPKICPVINARMATLNNKFINNPELKLLSISVDPKNDTPEQIKKYFAKFNPDPNRWIFALNNPERVQKLIADLKLASGSTLNEHNTRITLVDPNGKILGFYSGLDPKAHQELEQKLTSLLQ